MCGLFGLYEFDQSSDLVSVQRCYNKTFQALSHRGPNNHGLENFRIRRKDSTQLGSLSLGHTRLSIIDLSLPGTPTHAVIGWTLHHRV